MEKKVIRSHTKGLIRTGKTDWPRVRNIGSNPIIDQENPELVNKMRFKKISK